MEIVISSREIYGRETFYPVCPKSMIFAEIAGTTTLTRGTLKRIRRLGYTLTLANDDPLAALDGPPASD